MLEAVNKIIKVSTTDDTRKSHLWELKKIKRQENPTLVLQDT